jgi:serine/threonine protein kinase
MTQGNDSNGAWDERLDPVIADYLAALERGESPDRDVLLTAHPALADALRVFFADHDRMRRLASPAGGFPELTGPYQSSAEPDLVGTVVAGRYKLLQRIGEGGMGTVYMAEQTTPVKRQVAVKLIKPGMDSRQVLARFEAERQALALMDHPNIAKVLDGGTTTGEPGGVSPGRPFFVMELVRGLPITAYSDEKRLSVPQRLDLFRQICSAVQHAHQKGIIHRDLKPTNVLVTEHDGKPVPKVIDFGLAKALHAQGLLTEKTLFTAFGTAVGTPAYMAPEQVGINALDVDTRVDIYALGVLLYELLTGTTPVDRQRLKAAVWDEVRRLIREEEPPRPSQRLSTSDALPSIAACRDTEPAKLGRLVRGDLDWIVMKALEKDRNRRYETATAFAEDVRRFQADEPVAAGPPTLAYRLRKFVRRNRAAVAAVGIIGLAVLLAVAGLTWGLVQTQWALDRVTEEERKTREALNKADAQRMKAETLAASLRIDVDLGEEDVSLRVLRLAQTLRQLPDHAQELREYLTLKILSDGQEIEPLAARSNYGSPGHWSLSPDGHTWFVQEEGAWRMWDTFSGRPVVLSPLGNRVVSDVFPAAGRLVTAKDDDRVVRLWDTAGRLILETAPFPGTIRRVVPSSDNRRLIVLTDLEPNPGDKDPSARTHVELLDGSDGRRVALLQGHTGPVHSADFSPDGQWVLTTSYDWYVEEKGEFGGSPYVLTARGDRTARAWSAEDGRLRRTVEGLPEESPWIGVNPTGTLACTIAGQELRWWRLPGWQPEGPPSPVFKHGHDKFGVFPHPEVVLITFDGWSPDLGKTRLNSKTLISRKGDREPLEVYWDWNDWAKAATPSDGRKFLTASGGVFDLDNSGRWQLPPPGRKYHPDARKLNGGGRLMLTPSGIIDLVTEKVVAAGNSHGTSTFWTLTAPGCLCALGRRQYNSFYQGNCVYPLIIPSFDADIPAATLELWAQVVTRGHLNDQGDFVKWDEDTWQTKRQELAATASPVGAFPFPGRVAQDRLYWLRQEHLKRFYSDDRERAVLLPLLDRLVAEEPTWQHFLRRAELLRRLEDFSPAVRDYLEAGRQAGPGFWKRQEYDVNSFVTDIAKRSDHRPEAYEAAMTLAGKVPSESRSDVDNGLLLYRVGRYSEALEVLSREKFGTFCAVGSAFSLTTPLLLPLLIQQMQGEIANNAVAAMCLFRMGRSVEAKDQLSLARQAADQDKLKRAAGGANPDDFEKNSPWSYYLHAAEALIEGKKP